jgi:hypothetical protein
MAASKSSPLLAHVAVGELHFVGHGESVLSSMPNQLRAMDYFPAHYGVERTTTLPAAV